MCPAQTQDELLVADNTPVTTCNVLMLVENNSYPWDRRVLHETQALHQAGYRMTVICPKGDSIDQTAWREVVDGVTVYRYPLLCDSRGKAGYCLEYLWSFICTFVLSVVVWCRSGLDIIHSANPPDMFFAIALPLKLFGKQYVFDEHDLCPELYESKFERKGWVYRALLALERRSYRTADLVISTNQSYRDIARERGGVTDQRSAIVRNGVDVAEWHRKTPRPDLKVGFTYMALYLGVMGKQDGVDRVVRAAQHIVYDLGRRNIVFILVGKGECWSELRELSEELKVDEFVRFVGRISDELLIDYLSTSDVCLAPDPPNGLNKLSTMTKIMEYMACENPIVSFDLPETRRSAGDSAVYVDGDDPRMFGAAIIELLEDEPRRARMKQIALERSIQVVGLDQSRQALLEAYTRLRGDPKDSL